MNQYILEYKESWSECRRGNQNYFGYNEKVEFEAKNNNQAEKEADKIMKKLKKSRPERSYRQLGLSQKIC